jgi:hypothetical protein
MNVQDLLGWLKVSPHTVEFNDVIAIIDTHYQFTPTLFRNGELLNEAGSNSGSCKIFSFALLHGLTERQTLACFGTYYRDDVLKHPLASDHQNIRNFMQTGWAGVTFNGSALIPSKSGVLS